MTQVTKKTEKIQLPKKIPGSTTGMFILGAVSNLGEHAFGSEIRRLLCASGFNVPSPRVYQTLFQLEQKDLLSSEVSSDKSITLRGKPVRVYQLTQVGKAVIEFMGKK